MLLSCDLKSTNSDTRIFQAVNHQNGDHGHIMTTPNKALLL
jgi:hypothetical protein